jgi:acetoin utilization deacetylase AcuC-like enzyme
MIDVFYSPLYVSAGHHFETTRKAMWVAGSLDGAAISGVRLLAPPLLSHEALCQVHDAAYVAAMKDGVPRGLAESQGFTWDKGLWPMVLASNGGVVAAALTALQSGVAGSLSMMRNRSGRVEHDGSRRWPVAG